MMDISKLKELVNLMTANDLSEVELKGEKESVMIKRGGPVTVGPPIVHYAHPPAPGHAAAGHASAAPASAVPAPLAAGIYIESPMVGTFYAAPNPDAAPFVKVGQTVTPDTVVCIIEAMKVFNEIKAEKSGIVESIMPKSGQSVEFGQKLFALK